jgi:hypothetical protein
MDTHPGGEYVALAVRLEANAAGKWFVHMDGTLQPLVLPLRPLALSIRLWRASETGLLRGTVKLNDTDRWAPLQSNVQLEELVREWLLGGTPAGASGQE